MGCEFWERVNKELRSMVESQRIVKDAIVRLLSATLSKLGDWMHTVRPESELKPMVFVVDEAHGFCFG